MSWRDKNCQECAAYFPKDKTCRKSPPTALMDPKDRQRYLVENCRVTYFPSALGPCAEFEPEVDTEPVKTLREVFEGDLERHADE